MKHFRLRKARADDIEFAFYVGKASFAQYVERAGGWDEAEERQLHLQRFTSQDFFVIQVSEIDVGILATVRQADCVKVNQLLLLPEHQSKGVGTACIVAEFLGQLPHK